MPLYRPQIDRVQLHAFDQHLSNCHGTWNMTRSIIHAGDRHVLCLRWILPGERWCDIPGYLEFLDVRQHRVLLRCFVRNAPKQSWSFNELRERFSSTLSSSDLLDALCFCQRQDFVVLQGAEWQAGPMMEHIWNLGATFEWAVQENLQRFHRAVALRCVMLKEFQAQQLGDIDVLAFTDDHLAITIECKSSTSGISKHHITRFLKRAALFPANIALLLIDTPDEHQIKNRLSQITSCLPSLKKSLPERFVEKGSCVYYVQDNLYIANTGGGIQATLDIVLHKCSVLRRT